jgi:predicted DNA-binding ribbon-helix-helix protein
MTSAELKRSIVLAGRKTSISLEEPFWQALKEIARKQNRKLADLIVSSCQPVIGTQVVCS